MTTHRIGQYVYEHPWAVRVCHWVNGVAILVLVMSGLRILDAFPSFGTKIPERDLVEQIPDVMTLGGWLGGALQWHVTFMWVYAGSAVFYVASQVASGHYRTVVLNRRDLPGILPMARHYFLFGPKPRVTAQYNPLQKLAYTGVLALGLLSLVTGVIMYKPVQFSFLTEVFGGFHAVRIAHFLAMCGIVSFVPGHLLMVAIHGWSNFTSIFTGWKRQ